MKCCKLKSHRELRIHFTNNHWYRFCKAHFTVLKKVKLKMGWSNLRNDSGGTCDIPWCYESLVHEVYPMRRKVVSFWQPAKGEKNA